MSLEGWFWGEKNDPHTQKWIEGYEKKIKRYHPKSAFFVLSESKNSVHDIPAHRKKNAQLLFNKLDPTDLLVVLDEQGEMLHSPALARRLEQWLGSSKRCVFCVGGAYGFDDSVKAKAHFVWSLSPLTLPHQLARVLVAEQLYRSFAILQGHPYHHV